MLTALSVRLPERQTGIRGAAQRLRRDKIQIEVKKARGVTLKHITYISFSGQVRLDKTDKIIGSQRSRLLCSDKLIFPHHSGYKRFSSAAFSSRLCENAAISILRNLENSRNIKLGIVDARGGCQDFFLSVLKYCADVKTFCVNPEVYREALDSALCEMGAAAVVTREMSDMYDRDFIIIPEKPPAPLKLSTNALVLGTCRDSAAAPNYFFSYKIKVPNGFDEIKPPELDGEYFCSALYTLGSQYELGSIVPVLIEGEGKTRTIETLRAYLAKCMC